MAIFRRSRTGNMGKPINKVKLKKSDPPRIELAKKRQNFYDTDKMINAPNHNDSV